MAPDQKRLFARSARRIGRIPRFAAGVRLGAYPVDRARIPAMRRAPSAKVTGFAALNPSYDERALSHRHAAVRALVKFLALRTSHPPPCRDTAVRALVVFLALRASHAAPCRDAAVRAFVVFLALRTSHPPACRDAAVRACVEFLALRTSLGWPNSP